MSNTPKVCGMSQDELLALAERIEDDNYDIQLLSEEECSIVARIVRLAASPDHAAPAMREKCKQVAMDAGGEFDTMSRGIAAAIDALPVDTSATFQSRVQLWMAECFGQAISSDKTERNHRFLEEALELVQSLGCTQSEAQQLVDYVYGRPQGEPNQEVGGVMVTLAALCLASNLDMAGAGETELARIWTKVERIRAKQAAKPKHSPLPGPSQAKSPEPSAEPVAWQYRWSDDEHAQWRVSDVSLKHPSLSTYEERPLYLHPAPAIDREAVARIIDPCAEWDAQPSNSELPMSLKDCGMSARHRAVARAKADAIIAMLNGGRHV